MPPSSELCEHGAGPDFPTEAEIITPAQRPARDVRDRRGSVRARAVWTREQGEHRHHRLPTRSPERDRAGADRRADAGEEAALVEDCATNPTTRTRRRLVIVPRSNRVDAEG
jgi:topoisomerase-4 subunit A